MSDLKMTLDRGASRGPLGPLQHHPMVEKTYRATHGNHGRSHLGRRRQNSRIAHRHEKIQYTYSGDNSPDASNLDFYRFVRDSSAGIFDPPGQVQPLFKSTLSEESLFQPLNRLSNNSDVHSSDDTLQTWENFFTLDAVPRQKILELSFDDLKSYATFGLDNPNLSISPNAFVSDSTRTSFVLDPDAMAGGIGQDYILPESVYENSRIVFPNQFPSHNELFATGHDLSSGDEAMHPVITPAPTFHDQLLYPELQDLRPRTPWNLERAHVSRFRNNATPGYCNSELDLLPPRSVDIHREEKLLNFGQSSILLVPDARSSSWGSDVASYSNSLCPSSSPQGSPQHTPISSDSPSPFPVPPLDETEARVHVFSGLIGPQKPKGPRGRSRPLTVEEKDAAQKVRKAGACWACHLSKVKCSPCYAGRPCQQCDRLSNKRRFCMLKCFNDPIESLQVFLTPEFLTSHLTHANVEYFVTQNVSSWEQHRFTISLTWFHRDDNPIVAEVVALRTHSPDSEAGVQYRSVSNMSERPTIKIETSPPLAIPLASLNGLTRKYLDYVENIVRTDLRHYCHKAYYGDQESDFPERLLTIIADFALIYDHPLLYQALEIHVAATILERAFQLTPRSLQEVNQHLGYGFLPKVSPRLACRQIKLAFFVAQRARITSCLKHWGTLMWSSSRATVPEEKWATSISVFLVLCLVMDKTLGSAYNLCELNIYRHGKEERKEREEFVKLVKSTERAWFERCQEILHSSFKTRKAGKESFNPIRDGEAKVGDRRIARFVEEMQGLVKEFESEIRAGRTFKSAVPWEKVAYNDGGRLACIFLEGFLERSVTVSR